MREGTEAIYISKPGESLKLLADGRTLVTHPDREPFLVLIDGRIEPIQNSAFVLEKPGH